jgi:K+-transporting ATPase ATPase C chain
VPSPPSTRPNGSRERRSSAFVREDSGRASGSSASGLDPDITLANAEFQLDRLAAKWAEDKKLKADDVRKDIEALLQQKAYAPWGGMIGERLVNVLDVNLELHKGYGDPA